MRRWLAVGLALLTAVVLTLRVQVSAARADPRSALDESGEPEPPSILALELIRALNSHDVETVVSLFDANATIQAERYAWKTGDIRTWSRMQSAALVHMQVNPDSFRAQGFRVQWTAVVDRSDWASRGIDSVAMMNEIWTEGDRIVHYNEALIDGALVPKFGDLWQPRAAPSLPAAQPPVRPSDATPWVVVALGISAAITLLVARRTLESSEKPRRTASTWAMRDLGDWQRTGRTEVTLDPETP
jgi:hypothetical protein